MLPQSTSGATVGEPTITDGAGNNWYLIPDVAGDYHVGVNGMVDASSYNVAQLVLSGGEIYHANTAGSWFKSNGIGAGWAWENAAPVASAAVGTPCIVDGSNNIWTLVLDVAGDYHVCVNGEVDATSYNVVQLAYVGGKVYHKNTGGNWFASNGAGRGWTWVSSLPVTTAGTTTTKTSGTATPAVTASGSRLPWNQPFANTSVWNTPIGSGAQWSTPSDAGTAQLIKTPCVLNCTMWSQPFYIGTASDPLVTVTCTDNQFPVAPQQIHIPIGAKPDPSSDAHMNFFDETQKFMWSYWGCSLNNGADVTGGITAGLGGVYNWCGDGINTANTQTDGNYNFGIGAIRDYDLANGIIAHVLRFSASPDITKSPSNTGNPGVDWVTNVPWPDKMTDYNGDTLYTGNLLYGSTIGIPKSVDLTQLGLSQGGMMLAKALQNYGAIMRDTGGSNQFTFYIEPLVAQNHPTLLTQMETDAPKLVSYLRVLLNQGPNSVNGGGTPIVTPPPALNTSYC